MKLSKKGQGISLNVIIIAAIALIVLVVLVMIFTGRMNIFGRNLENTQQTCEDQGGERALATEGCEEDYRQIYGAFSDLANNEICCVPT